MFLCEILCSYSDILTEKVCHKPGGASLYGRYGDVPLDVKVMVFDLSFLNRVYNFVLVSSKREYNFV